MLFVSCFNIPNISAQFSECSCGDYKEAAIHYLLHCPNYLDERKTLLDNLQSIGEKIHHKNDSQIRELLLCGVSSSNDASNKYIFFLFYQSFLSRIVATHRTAGERRGPSFIPLCHFQSLTNIQTFI